MDENSFFNNEPEQEKIQTAEEEMTQFLQEICADLGFIESPDMKTIREEALKLEYADTLPARKEYQDKGYELQKLVTEQPANTYLGIANILAMAIFRCEHKAYNYAFYDLEEAAEYAENASNIDPSLADRILDLQDFLKNLL